MKANRVARQLTVLAAALPLLFSLLQAQNGIVRGIVTDEEGNPIQDAQIRIEGMNVNRKYKVKTNKRGEYIHIGVSLQGVYRVIAEKEGYQGDFVEGLKPGFDRNGPGGEANFTLKKGQARKMTFEMTQEEIDAARKAAQDAEKAAAKNAALQASFNAGVEAYNAGDYELARQKFEEATTQAPDEATAWGNLGQTYSRLEQYDKAIENYQKALELKPDDPSFLQNLGNAYAASGNAEESEKYFAKAAQLAGAVDPSAAAASFYNIAVNYINSGDNEKAKEALEKALAADPNHPDAHYQMGLVLLNLGDMDNCLAHLKKYLEVAPNGDHAKDAKDLLAALQQ